MKAKKYWQNYSETSPDLVKVLTSTEGLARNKLGTYPFPALKFFGSYYYMVKGRADDLDRV